MFLWVSDGFGDGPRIMGQPWYLQEYSQSVQIIVHPLSHDSEEIESATKCTGVDLRVFASFSGIRWN